MHSGGWTRVPISCVAGYPEPSDDVARECGLDAFHEAVGSEGDNIYKACAKGDKCIEALEDQFDVTIECGDLRDHVGVMFG